MPSTARCITLRDGRALGYAEYGDREGTPLFYFHGLPGSRLDARITEPVASEQGVRVIGLDRPGFGLSDFQPGRTIGAWADDVADAADALGIRRFAVVGVSGGGPYAAACAARLRHRLIGAGIVCGLGPLRSFGALMQMKGFARVAFLLARYAPWLSAPVCRTIARQARSNPDVHFSPIESCDRCVLAREEIRRALAESFREAIRNGIQGTLWELRLHTRDWDFRLEDIAMPVHLWHGERDASVPVALGRRQARALRRCRASFYPNEGHFSLPVNRMSQILAALSR